MPGAQSLVKLRRFPQQTNKGLHAREHACTVFRFGSNDTCSNFARSSFCVVHMQDMFSSA